MKRRQVRNKRKGGKRKGTRKGKKRKVKKTGKRKGAFTTRVARGLTRLLLRQHQ